jgi:hypothetical protein
MVSFLKELQTDTLMVQKINSPIVVQYSNKDLKKLLMASRVSLLFRIVNPLFYHVVTFTTQSMVLMAQFCLLVHTGASSVRSSWTFGYNWSTRAA